MNISLSKIVRLFFIAVSPAILIIIGCQEKPQLDARTVMIIGDQPVSLEVFRLYYELDPAFPGVKSGEQGLTEYAEMIADRIFATRLAREEHLFDYGELNKQLAYRHKMALIRQLYKNEVEKHISVSDQELREVFRRMAVQIRVKHLFAPTLDQANQLYTSLQGGVPFDTLAKSVFAGIPESAGGADLGTITWGELDPALEDAAISMKTGVFSAPVKSKWGYHILLVTDRKENLSLSESDFREKRSMLSQKVKWRKEKRASTAYLKSLLDPLNIRVKAPAFLQFAHAFGLGPETPQKHVERPIPLSDQQITHAKAALSEYLNQTVMTSKWNSWTIKDLLNELEAIPVTERLSLRSIVQLKTDVGLLIRDRFLYETALEKGLNDGIEIDSIMNENRGDLAYRHYLDKEIREFTVPNEVHTYFQNREKGIAGHVPAGILPKIHREEIYRIYYAGQSLHNKLHERFTEIAIAINDSLIREESRRINWNNPLRLMLTEKH